MGTKAEFFLQWRVCDEVERISSTHSLSSSFHVVVIFAVSLSVHFDVSSSVPCGLLVSSSCCYFDGRVEHNYSVTAARTYSERRTDNYEARREAIALALSSTRLEKLATIVIHHVAAMLPRTKLTSWGQGNEKRRAPFPTRSRGGGTSIGDLNAHDVIARHGDVGCFLAIISICYLAQGLQKSSSILLYSCTCDNLGRNRLICIMHGWAQLRLKLLGTIQLDLILLLQ